MISVWVVKISDNRRCEYWGIREVAGMLRSLSSWYHNPAWWKEIAGVLEQLYGKCYISCDDVAAINDALEDADQYLSEDDTGGLVLTIGRDSRLIEIALCETLRRRGLAKAWTDDWPIWLREIWRGGEGQRPAKTWPDEVRELAQAIWEALRAPWQPSELAAAYAEIDVDAVSDIAARMLAANQQTTGGATCGA